jgi:hypothetical protein
MGKLPCACSCSFPIQQLPCIITQVQLVVFAASPYTTQRKNVVRFTFLFAMSVLQTLLALNIFALTSCSIRALALSLPGTFCLAVCVRDRAWFLSCGVRCTCTCTCIMHQRPIDRPTHDSIMLSKFTPGRQSSASSPLRGRLTANHSASVPCSKGTGSSSEPWSSACSMRPRTLLVKFSWATVSARHECAT